jgi:tetratricopeptide (TPR) repeat protein
MRRPVTQAKPVSMKPPPPGVTQPRWLGWLLAGLLVLVTLAAYWPATSHDFVNYDDDPYVTSNVHVQNGLTLETIKWAFYNPVAANWHPLAVLSHMLDCQLFGLNPWGHHLTSVLLHALNAMLVFALLQQMTGTRWQGLLVAALFAVHPLRVESVAWVAERKDVLSGCFGLLALVFYARYAKVQRQKAEAGRQKPEGRGPWSLSYFPSSIFYLLSLCFFALGLMSKPMLVTWPFVRLLLDYWPLERGKPGRWWRLVREKIPFFALAAVASVVTFVVQKQGGAVVAVEKLPLGARSGNALISYCRYLGKVFWPTDLAVFYPLHGEWPLEKVLLASGLILGISGLLVVQRRQFPFLLMGWLWFVGTLVPVIGLLQVGDQAMADRYTYIPSLGVLILVIWGVYELTRRWPYGVIALWGAGSAAVVLCLALTRHQLGHWKNSEALFWHALLVTENNGIARKAFGDALDKRGQTDEAIRNYREALRLRPSYADAHNNLGIALCKKGQIDEAISHYQEAIRLKPNYVAHNNLGGALARKGRMDEAISHYQEAIRLKPDYAEAQYNLGNTLGSKGQIDEAITYLQEAIRLKPDYAEAQYNLGNALGSKGRIDEAIALLQEALRLKPDYAEAHNDLGTALGIKGRTDEAIVHFREALRLTPDYTAARKNLDTALATKTQASPPAGAATNR